MIGVYGSATERQIMRMAMDGGPLLRLIENDGDSPMRDTTSRFSVFYSHLINALSAMKWASDGILHTKHA